MTVLQITQVKVRPVPAEAGSRLKAFATIIFNDSLVINDIKIIEGKERLFIAMPSRKTKEGSYVDVVHPINIQTRQMVEDAILTQYQSLLSV